MPKISMNIKLNIISWLIKPGPAGQHIRGGQKVENLRKTEMKTNTEI